MNFKKGDLLIHFHNFYSPIIVMEDGIKEKKNCNTSIKGGVTTHSNVHYTKGVAARSIGMRQDYIYDKLDSLLLNLGQMTFEYFYENYETLVPQYEDGIREEYNRQVYFIDITREQSYGLKGTTKEEIYKEKMSMFPLS